MVYWQDYVNWMERYLIFPSLSNNSAGCPIITLLGDKDLSKIAQGLSSGLSVSMFQLYLRESMN